MMRRRDMLISAACLAAAGVAYELKPHRKVSLQGDVKLENVVPSRFGDWVAKDVSDLVAPTTPDSVAGRLYNETVGRVYSHPSTPIQVMVLLAHGSSQTNNLQLHRPEVCYPAFGFAIAHTETFQLPLTAGVDLPARRLVAIAPERREHIIYWTRLGEFLPVTGAEQRLDRLSTSMHGIVADGLLARFSVVGDNDAAIFPALAGFVAELIRAVPSEHRAGLIGSARAQALASIKA